jgi:cyclic pyranopterin phosphate synthase
MKNLSHIDSQGRARMVDVGHKEPMHRIAKASGFISLSHETLTLIRQNAIKKGDVLTVAEIAGVQAAKKTHELIPLAHPVVLDCITVTASMEESGIAITGEVSCTGRTGVEMEALTAVSTGLLAVYDMCKAVDKKMEIGQIKLINKIKTGIQV